MAINDVSFYQRVVIKFLIKENNSAVNFFDQLCHVCGDSCMGASGVHCWVKYFEDGSRDISDLPCSDRPRITRECNNQKVDAHITEDQGLTVKEIIVQLGIGHSAVQEMIKTGIPDSFSHC
jgi:hypothetical protein